MSSAPRVAKHRARMKGRAELLARLLDDTATRVRAIALIDATPSLAIALANDPLLLANGLQQRELTGYATLQGRAAPQVPPAPSPSPLRGEEKQPPLPTTVIPSPASPARQRDALIDAWADVFGKGDYRNLSDREFGQALKANQKLRKMAERTGRTTDEMADGIRVAANNWPNVMTANRSMSIAMIVDNWGALVHGPHTKGRSNGTVHTQYLNESAAVKHTPKLQSQESYRRD
jgi:hypothetical protein